MRLRVTIETVSPNGTRDVRFDDFSKEELIIGRGAGSDILLDHPSVSFSHAKISTHPLETRGGTGVFIEDLASLSGVLVNKNPVVRHELSLGDVISLGAEQFTVRAADGVIDFYRQRKVESVDLETKIRRDLQELLVTGKLPAQAILSIFLVSLVIAVYFVIPVLGEDKESWSTGPVISGHKMIEHDCRACHDGQFVRISDAKCMSCHNMTDHSEFFVQHANIRKELEPSCASCHLDHSGPRGGIIQQSALCTNCHARIDDVLAPVVREEGVAKPTLELVPSFAAHPQFAVTLQPERPGVPGKRVRLDDVPNLKDVSHIKLNHKVHLQKDLRTRTGFKTLGCNDCHALKSDFKNIERISFEQHCQECHSLEFDERLPGVEVPHGGSDVVYRFLYAEYAKLLLSNERASPIRREFQQRGGRIPGRGRPEPSPEVVAEVPSGDEFSRGFVERESRGAERVLFTRTACLLCHSIAEKRISEFELRENATSQYQVLEPQIPERWMPASIFGHGAHEELSCESCHEGVRNSTKTSDVLLPKIEGCRDCHVEHPEIGKITSNCILCHSYHDSTPMPAERKRTVEEIIGGLGL